MKALITYFSRSGNMEKVAEAIHEEALNSRAADLQKLENVNPEQLDDYDFIFIGSPLHAWNISEPVKDFLNRMRWEPGRKLACFVTHAAPAYPDQDLEKFIEPVKAACEENRIDFVGSFDCQGYLEEAMHEFVKTKQGDSDEEWARKIEEMTGRPNEADLARARAFARGLLGE